MIYNKNILLSFPNNIHYQGQIVNIDSGIPSCPLRKKEQRSDTILHFITKVPRARERKY